MSPFERSAGERESTLFRAPRGLKEPVFWKLSHLRKSRTPARSPSEDAERIGVRWMRPRIRSAALRMAESSIGATAEPITRPLRWEGRGGIVFLVSSRFLPRSVPESLAMNASVPRTALVLSLAVLALASPAARGSALAPIRLRVDMTEAPERVLHAHLAIPVRPGEVTLFYPKWIPGEHGPTGPLVNVAGFTVVASGKPLEWKRDLVEMDGIHVTVPPGTKTLEVAFDFLLSTSTEGYSYGAGATPNLAVLNWNQVLVYPTGPPPEALTYAASVQLPAGWKYGTAVPVAHETGGWVEFKPASLVTLIDSPLNAGRWFREIPLAPEITPRHYLDLVGASRESIQITPEQEEKFSRPPRQPNHPLGPPPHPAPPLPHTLPPHRPPFRPAH